jgi:NB-ARC domain
VSTVDLWDRLKILLPDSNNGSRVLITSRSIDVAMAADPETTPYKLSYLTEEESVQFLLTKAFPHKKLENCPPDLMKAEKQLTQKCGGLPLALVVVGGILSRRESTYSVWNIVEHDRIYCYGHDHLVNPKHKLSYLDLCCQFFRETQTVDYQTPLAFQRSPSYLME